MPHIAVNAKANRNWEDHFWWCVGKYTHLKTITIFHTDLMVQRKDEGLRNVEERCRERIDWMAKWFPNWNKPEVEFWSLEQVQEHFGIRGELN